MRRRGLIGLMMLFPASPAAAHAFLEHANPPAGSEVATPPSEISLSFTEGVEPLFSTIEVHGPDNATIRVGKLHIVSDNRRLVVELPKLPSGTYTVIWHVTSVDTHKTEGSYRFTVMH